MRDAGATPDAGDIVDAGDVLQDGAGWMCAIPDAGDVADGSYGSPGWTCTIPAQALTSATCEVTPNQYGGCGPTQYHLSCSEQLDASSLGCTFGGGGTGRIGDAAPVTTYGYCCFCEGTDAATGCVNVDLSTYDRSCTKDSDCTFIGTGMVCPGACNCGPGNAAINVDGERCYEQAVAQVALNNDCNCANWPTSWVPVCVQGVCTSPPSSQ